MQKCGVESPFRRPQSLVRFLDRRQYTRFDLSAPVTYSWEGRESIHGTGHGTTRDVSERGLFVLTDSFPLVGTVIEFEVSFSFGDDSEIQMRAKGKVIRVEAADNTGLVQGFAAVTRVLWFRNEGFSSGKGTNAGR